MSPFAALKKFADLPVRDKVFLAVTSAILVPMPAKAAISAALLAGDWLTVACAVLGVASVGVCLTRAVRRDCPYEPVPPLFGI